MIIKRIIFIVKHFNFDFVSKNRKLVQF